VSHAGTSAESALRSVKLQEAQLRQWVDTDNWKLQAPSIPPNATAITMRIAFDIVNPTSMPLTLKYVWCDGNFIWGQREFSLEESSRLICLRLMADSQSNSSLISLEITS